MQDRLITLVSRRERARATASSSATSSRASTVFAWPIPAFFKRNTGLSPIQADPLSVRIDLQANFRSRPEILEAVNFLFRQIMYPETAEIDYDERQPSLRPGREEPGEPLEPACVEVHLIERTKERARCRTKEDAGDGEPCSRRAGGGCGRPPDPPPRSRGRGRARRQVLATGISRC